ncbi:MAG: sulfatase, partial [Candidatus Nanohaloarchaea archaeon]
DEKVEWDSLGTTKRWRLDMDKPNWQELEDDGIDIPDWATNHFDEDIETVKERAQADEQDEESMEASVKQRLEDLGYM